MPNPPTVTPAVILATCFSLLGGGLMGSVFTWYVHQLSPTLVTYQVTKAITGADSITKGLIPNLTIKIGNEDVPVVYTDVIEFSTASGEYVDSAEIAITFPSALRIFGSGTISPSPVHSITCRTAPAGLVCRLSPLAPGTKYTVNIAADQGGTPSVITASRNVELVSVDTFVSNESRSWKARLFSRSFGLFAAVFVIYLTGVYFAVKRLTQLFRRRNRLAFVGRLVDSSGTGISGAVVQIRVNEPAKNKREYEAVSTDKEGDFLVNIGAKQQGLRGTIRIEREGHSTVEAPFENPVLFLTLAQTPPSQSIASGAAPCLLDAPDMVPKTRETT